MPKKRKNPKSTTRYTVADVEALATKLEVQAAQVTALLDAMKSEKVRQLYLFNHASLQLAENNVKHFLEQALESLEAHRAGEPWTENTTRRSLDPRYPENRD